MKKIICLIAVCMMVAGNIVLADTFGTGDNAFTIDFVSISGSTNPGSGYGIVNKDYRIGTYEITNDQWNKFTGIYGTPYGIPTNAYDRNSYYTSKNVPTNNVSWYEAAQFVNWLNTSCGYQSAYKFTGTRGQSDYTFAPWSSSDVGYNASNPFRNSQAFYFLPTEDEWVKAAYWNGANVQIYATKANETLFQGNGLNGGWNYNGTIGQPWNVGSGSEELNGTFDMMGNVWEWMESPQFAGDYTSGSFHPVRGGSYSYFYPGNGDGNHDALVSSNRDPDSPISQNVVIGFRVASIPEPCTLLLLGLGGLPIRKR
jgi:formylglycine-generating enzyme required for sulfatase activity